MSDIISIQSVFCEVNGVHIFLENKSNKTLLINLNGQHITLNPFGRDVFTLNGNRVSLNLSTDDKYSSDKYAEKAGYYCFHRFITVSQYNFSAENDLALELYVETKKGDNFESYQRVSPYCKDFTLPEPIYTLKDEAEVKERFIANENLEKKAERRANLFEKADRIDNVVSSVIIVLFAIGLFALIFGFIWVNFSLKAAITTLAILIFIGFIICKIIAKLVNRIGKTADKFFNSKLFNKVVDKTDEKFEEKFVYCKDMPEGLFKDRSSFFDPTYISAVFKYSNKNI